MLVEQKEILVKLLELSREERQILINGESDKLEAVVRLQLKQLSKLGAVEKRRAELNKEIAAELSLTEDDITITSIVNNSDPAEKAILLKMQTELMALINEHAQVNAENRELINSHMEYSGAMIEMLSEPDDPLNNFYGDDGRATDEKKKTSGMFTGHA
jgi:flagellar biosynthesis/type III secretory pathway chaperone